MPNFPESKPIFTNTNKTKKKKRGLGALLKAKAKGKVKTPVTMSPARKKVLEQIGK
jgi:hypothetical protein